MRLAARASPTRVATATVMTSPPTISGISISAPVRAVEVPAMVELECVVELLELELEFVFEFEFELDCALATPASVKLIMNARNAPASKRRAMDPVVRTFFSPIRVC